MRLFLSTIYAYILRIHDVPKTWEKNSSWFGCFSCIFSIALNKFLCVFIATKTEMKFPIENPRKQVNWDPEQGWWTMLFLFTDKLNYLQCNSTPLLISATSHGDTWGTIKYIRLPVWTVFYILYSFFKLISLRVGSYLNVSFPQKKETLLEDKAFGVFFFILHPAQIPRWRVLQPPAWAETGYWPDCWRLL